MGQAAGTGQQRNSLRRFSIPAAAKTGSACRIRCRSGGWRWRRRPRISGRRPRSGRRWGRGSRLQPWRKPQVSAKNAPSGLRSKPLPGPPKSGSKFPTCRTVTRRNAGVNNFFHRPAPHRSATATPAERKTSPRLPDPAGRNRDRPATGRVGCRAGRPIAAAGSS